MRKIFKYIGFGLLVIGSAANAQNPTNPSSPKFADIFTNDAIIQRNLLVKIWGKAKPNSQLILKINSQNYNLISNNNGKWQIEIDSSKFEKISTFAILDNNNNGQTISNIRLGDVFLCSGQSNMEFKLKYATNAEWEIKAADSANISFINVPRNFSTDPQDDFLNYAQWQNANSQNIGEASAICFFAARKIAKSQNIPVGIINASWGGSHIEPWISRNKLENIGGFQKEIELQNLYIKNPTSAADELNKSNDIAWDAIDKGVKGNWHLGLDNKNWEKINHKDIWENSNIEQLKDFDGIIYYKTKFNLNSINNLKSPSLYLGRIDDNDETYINGVKIGQSGQWDYIRNYKIPPNVLKAGENTLIIKIKDTGGGGGLWGANQPIGIYDDELITEFNNDFLYKISANKNEFMGSNIVPWDATNGISTLYNGMLNPVKDYAINGFFWYQGESNADAPQKYGRLLNAFIEEIRQNAKNENLPFFLVQLANYGKLKPGIQNSNWAKLRAVQFETSQSNKNVFMASTIDIGDPYDIHPSQKRIIGERLADLALTNIYKVSNHEIPSPKTAKRIGKNIYIEFINTGGGLMTISSQKAIGFEACEQLNKNCSFVDGFINGNFVILKNISPNKIYIRYLWANSPIANLYSKNEQAIGTFELKIK